MTTSTPTTSTTPTTLMVVESMARAGKDVLLIELRAANLGTDGSGATLPEWTAGSHVDIHLGPVLRQYSLIGDPSAEGSRDRWHIAVRRDDIGRGGSKVIHEQLRVGHTLEVTGPRNNFPLAEPSDTENPGRTILLAGGIGITPLLSMAEAQTAVDLPVRFHCYSSNQTTMPMSGWMEGKVWEEDVVKHFSERGDSLRTASMLPEACLPGDHLYICGPAGFIDRAVAIAEADGWPTAAVHVERFALSEPVDLTGDSFTVTAASTGDTMTVGENQTIAEVLLEQGYPVELSCEMGICGSCLTGVVAGTPEHRDESQSPVEHASNSRINVCCSRSKTPSLTLEV